MENDHQKRHDRRHYWRTTVHLAIAAAVLVSVAYFLTRPSQTDVYLRKNCSLINQDKLQTGQDKSEIWDCAQNRNR